MTDPRGMLLYMVGMPSGLRDEDGVELLVCIDVKTTRLAADQLQEANPGSVIRKMWANKETANQKPKGHQDGN